MGFSSSDSDSELSSDEEDEDSLAFLDCGSFLKNKQVIDNGKYNLITFFPLVATLAGAAGAALAYLEKSGKNSEMHLRNIR